LFPGKDFGPEWWYITGESGQHIAFYPVSSLQEIANQVGGGVLRSRILIFSFEIIRHGAFYFMKGLRRNKSPFRQDQELAKKILKHKTQE
jgi:hypothetical protein